MFDKATIEIPLRHSQGRIVDSREQALIAEFGSSTLLNSSVGGMEAVVKSHPQDDAEFSSLNTQTISRLEWRTSELASTKINQLQNYGRAIQHFAKTNPDSTNYSTYPITDEARDLVVNQSIPIVSNGHAILVTIGSDLGAESLESMTPFYHGGVRSSFLTIQVLESMVHRELGYSTTTMHRIPELQRQCFLPFVDLYPWARKDPADLPNAMQFLRRYLHIASPIVVMTFSKTVAGVCLGSFHQKNGLPRGSTLSEISGQLFLSKYDHDPTEDKDEDCVVVIPCIHPGSLRYANDNEPMGRIFAKTLAVAWLAMHVALDVLQTPGQSKKQMCQAVIDTVQSLTGPNTQFGKTFQKVRDEYIQKNTTYFTKRYGATDLKFQRLLERTAKVADSHQEQNLLAIADVAHTSSRFQIQWDTEAPQLPAAFVRCRNALEQLYMITDYDIAEGTPTSEVRQAQIDRLIGMNANHLNVYNLSDQDFVKSLKKVKAGQWYYLATTQSQHQAADLAHLLSFFVPAGVNVISTEWLSDNAIVRSAVTDMTAFISKLLAKGTKKRQEAQANINLGFQQMLQAKNPKLLEAVHQLRRWQPIQTTTYRSSPHKIVVKVLQEKKHGLMEFQWEHNGAEVKMEDFYLPMAAVPILPGEERFISL